MPSKDKYTDPELRDQVKEELHEGDKGGQPGQWSARKAQMMAQEYKKRGGGYTTDKDQQDESQKNLENWGKEDWQTKEGSGNAKKEDGTEKRYLPKKAWENMTEEEQRETDDKKQEQSKQGKQYVENTRKAKESRKGASEAGEKQDGEDHKNQERGEEEEDEDDTEAEYEDSGDNDGTDDVADAEDAQDGTDEHDVEADDNDDDDDKEETRKRKRSGSQTAKKSKKQRNNSGDNGSKSNGTVGSKHMSAEEPAPRGATDRLPHKGQRVTWKAMPGYVDGEVLEVLTEDKKVDGKSIKASESAPRIVLKSRASGKICVHKPEACFYDDA